jgi:hypothetical protein
MDGIKDQIAGAEALELQKVRIRHEMQEEITSWAKTRFAVLGALVAVLSFFGLNAVLNQSLQSLVTNLVTKPVEQAQANLNEATKAANQVIARLDVLSDDVEEKGLLAQEAAAAATAKIDELELNIHKASENANAILDQYTHISKGMSRVSNDIFTLASVIRAEERLLKIETRKASDTLSALEDLNIAIAGAFRSTQADAAVEIFEARMQDIRTNYIASVDRLSKIRDFNIVFYIRRHEDDALAQAIVRELKGEGYRAAVWYAQGDGRGAAVKEIASEFGDIADILDQSASGIVSHPAHGDVAAEIDHLLSAKFKTMGHSTFTRPLHPIEQHLIHDQGQKTFDPDKVILIYSLGPNDA